MSLFMKISFPTFIKVNTNKFYSWLKSYWFIIIYLLWRRTYLYLLTTRGNLYTCLRTKMRYIYWSLDVSLLKYSFFHNSQCEYLHFKTVLWSISVMSSIIQIEKSDYFFWSFVRTATHWSNPLAVVNMI